jgi:hypothetical protein
MRHLMPPRDLSLLKRQMQLWVNVLMKALIFMLLVPGVHLTIPPGASLREQALIHGAVFAVVNHLAYNYLLPMLERFENPDSRVKQPCPPGYDMCPSGDCRLASDVHSPCN